MNNVTLQLLNLMQLRITMLVQIYDRILKANFKILSAKLIHMSKNRQMSFMQYILKNLFIMN